MSVYDINGNEVSSSGISSPYFQLLAGNGDKATLVWQQGAINPTTGADTTNSTRIRTQKYSRFDFSRYLFVHCPDGFKARAAIYDATTSTPVFDKITSFATGDQLLKTEQENLIYRFVLGKTDDSALSTSDLPSDFYVIPVYMSIWDAEASGKAVGPYTTARNNPDKIAEILAVAWTYRDNGSAMTYGQSTCFDNNTYVNTIDCSTFVGLCLRGIPYQDTPYYSHEDRPMDDYPANPSYTWSINPFDYKLAGEPTMRIRSASRLAKWLINQRRQIPLDGKLANVEPGDIVFYSRLNSDGSPVNPHRFMYMTHVALVISKRRVTEYSSTATYAKGDLVQYNSALYEAKAAISTAEAWTSSHWTKLVDGWDISVVPYYHQTMESTTTTPTININYLEKQWDSPTVYTSSNINTLSLVCRPDLGSL